MANKEEEGNNSCLPPQVKEAMLRRVACSNYNPGVRGWTDESLSRSANALRIQDYERFIHERGIRYRDSTIENYAIECEAQQKVIDALNAFAFDRNLIFAGHCGTGKDHLMAAMIKRAIGQYRQVSWINGQDLFGGARERTFRNFDEWQELLCEPEILAISDPLPTSGGPLGRDEANSLYRIVDERYANRRNTWITINTKTSDDMASRLSLPVTDRLLDFSLVLVCEWDSYRKRETIAVPPREKT